MIGKEAFKKKQIVYCFCNAGEQIRIKNDNVLIKNKDQTTKIQVSCYRIFALFIIGDCSLSTYVFRYAKKFGFGIVLMNSSFKILEILGFKLEGNTLLERKQHNYISMDIPKYIVENKINNQIKTLKKIRCRDENLNKTIRSIEKYKGTIFNQEKNVHELMGVEGVCAKLYFGQLFGDFDWIARRPRIKMDYINACLDIGYTILFNYIDALLRLYGFNTYVGFLHTLFYQRKSLVCDLVEPFRPIVDYQIRKSINLGQIRKIDFRKNNGKCILKFEENKKYVKIFSECINFYNEEIFLYIQSFYRNLMKGESIESYQRFDI